MSHLDVFRFLPKTDCGECASPTCLAFAKRVDAGQAEITVCPYVAFQCAACGFTQDEPFRQCPSCKVTVREARTQEDSCATRCPKCGYEQAEPFDECPKCGVSVAMTVRNARRMGKTAVFEAPVKDEPAAPAASPKTKEELPIYQCPFCGFVTQKVLSACPECGYAEGPGFNGG